MNYDHFFSAALPGCTRSGATARGPPPKKGGLWTAGEDSAPDA